ncbi:TPA: KOW motif-containing protein, partial [Clostridioides difficile]
PLTEEEVAFMKSFGKEEHVVEMSTGFIQGEQIFIIEGPLQGKEGQIIRIDRHKRIAYLQLSMFNKETTTKVGLEIISKC